MTERPGRQGSPASGLVQDYVVTLFALPENEPTERCRRPRLESWNKSDHPDQVALRAWVAHVRERVGPLPAGSGPLALRLDIGLEERADPLWERDLDNYLFPIARELPDRIVSFWATKARGTRSFVRIEPADPVHEPSDWPMRSSVLGPAGRPLSGNAIAPQHRPHHDLPGWWGC